MSFTYEEQQLISLYNTSGTRNGLIAELNEMKSYLTKGESDLVALTDSAIQKLSAMDDTAFAALDLTPDLFPEDNDAE